MNKKLLLVVLVLVLSAGSAWALPIAVENSSFELPGVGKPDIADVPGWTSEGTGGGGAETDWGPTDGLYTGFLGGNMEIFQLTGHTIAAGEEYTLTVDARRTWEGPNIMLGLYYDDGGARVQMASLFHEFVGGSTTDMEELSLVAIVGDDSSAIGNKLGIQIMSGDPDASWIGFDNVRLDVVTEPVTIPVDPNSDLAAANELAQSGDTIEFAAGTYYITSQIEVKDGVTYKGAGPGLTVIDGNDATRAFVAWGDRFFNEDSNGVNDSGPKGWVIEAMTIQNCVADANDRFSYTSVAYNLKINFAELDANATGGLDPNEANSQTGGIRLAGPDGQEGTEDDDLHRFAHIDTDGNGELSEAELDAQLLLREDEFGDQNRNGGAIFVGNQASGTIGNCNFLGNHTPIEGDDGGAISISGNSVVTIADCWFEGNHSTDDGGAVDVASLSTATINDTTFTGNYAASPDSVPVEGLDGDGGHIKVQGNSASAITPGTTLIANRCVFLNGNASDDGGAIQSAAIGTVVRLDSCRFEGNTSWDNGNVFQFMNNAQYEVTVTNCIFVNNVTKADNSPDRMIETNRNSKFINCTFVGNNQEDQDLIYNNANVQDTDGDGVDDETADATLVINCIFANNVIGNGDHILSSRDDNFTIVATNCLFYGNTRQNGSAAPNSERQADETGSITDDPLLDIVFMLIPEAGSPAIDAGIDPAAVGVTLTTDYNGNTRPQGAGYDIGAFEAQPPAE